MTRPQLTHHSQYRNLFPDIESQQVMRLANGLLYLGRGISSGEDEAEVAGAFG